ncbi:hypothetical protein LG202_24100 [Methylobacillus methanolivorans]
MSIAQQARKCALLITLALVANTAQAIEIVFDDHIDRHGWMISTAHEESLLADTPDLLAVARHDVTSGLDLGSRLSSPDLDDGKFSIGLQVSAVPEPSTFWMLLLGLVGVFARWHRKQSRSISKK